MSPPAKLIPARAGNTRPAVTRQGSGWAHPRLRGEHQRAPRLRRPFHGSSPLTRGTRALLRPRCTCQGLIPAHAGNTTQRPVMALCTWAHPRSREEHSSTARISKPPPGSSPLARGTRHSRTTARVSPGLIPARAGNTNPASARKGHGGAHPRSRGEHATPGALEAAARGSSPLARGTRWCVARQAAHRGLIPARAGNTLMLHESAINIWAHPRSRGEHGLVEQLQGVRLGSSPLARGTRQSGAGKLTRRGLIPARAGNTGRVAVTGGVRRAHPRSRGEHRLSAHLYFDLPGSSPLARGTLTGGAPAICRVGLIPARAGNT